MPTPIRMVPLDMIANLRSQPASLLDWAQTCAVLAIPVKGDGTWLEGVTLQDVREFIEDIENGVDLRDVLYALRKAAGA